MVYSGRWCFLRGFIVHRPCDKTDVNMWIGFPSKCYCIFLFHRSFFRSFVFIYSFYTTIYDRMLIRSKLIPTIEFLLQITWVLRKCNMHTNTHCAMVVDILWNRLGWVSVYFCISLSFSLFHSHYVYALYMCVFVQWCIYRAKLYSDVSFVHFHSSTFGIALLVSSSLPHIFRDFYPKRRSKL